MRRGIYKTLVNRKWIEIQSKRIHMGHMLMHICEQSVRSKIWSNISEQEKNRGFIRSKARVYKELSLNFELEGVAHGR